MRVSLAEVVRQYLALGEPGMIVRVAAARSSTPRGTDAAMLVSAEASQGASGGARQALAMLTCPIGGPGIADKRPEVIAALTAAELPRCMAARSAADSERSTETAHA